MKPKMGDVTFTASERARLAEVCKALGTTFAEFVHFATMEAVSEVEGYGAEAAAERAAWDALNGRERVG